LDTLFQVSISSEIDGQKQIKKQVIAEEIEFKTERALTIDKV